MLIPPCWLPLPTGKAGLLPRLVMFLMLISFAYHLLIEHQGLQLTLVYECTDEPIGSQAEVDQRWRPEAGPGKRGKGVRNLIDNMSIRFLTPFLPTP